MIFFCITVDLNIMIEEKNPLHREYGLFSNINYVLQGMRKYSKILMWMLPIGFVISPIQRYLWSFITKFVIDIVTNNSGVKNLLFVIGAFSVISLLVFLCQTFYNNKVWVQCIVVRMKIILKKNLLMMKMPFEFTENPDVLDCCQKAENAVSGNEQGYEGMEHQIVRFFEQLGIVIAGLVILGTMNVWIVVGMTLLAVINFLISNAASKYSKRTIWDPLAPWWRKRWYMNIALSDFSYAKDVRLFGLQKWLTNKFKELNVERYEAQRKNNRLWFWVTVSSSFFWLIFQGAVYAYLIIQVVNKNLTIGNFTLYLSSAGTFFECISALLNCFTQMMQKSREIDDFRTFMEIESIVKEIVGSSPTMTGNTSPTMTEKRASPTPQKTTMSFSRSTRESPLPEVPSYNSYEFEFKNVSFKYPRAEKYALKNLNLKLKAGERLAVVGLNGAGKSTFIKLLLRLYEPTEGQILLNGVDISTYDLESYFNVFAPVFQDINLFALTFAENVSMESHDQTNLSLVEEYTKNSGLEEKLNNLPNGLNTQMLKIIYDDGIDMSGGEKQKLALARALYKNSPVVVLDEPTSALDAIAESKLYQEFDKLIGGKTAVYISHRLSSTQFCNNVAMFMEGKMIEYGTHDSLMAQGGEYAKMFKIQSQYYIDEMEKSESDEQVAEVSHDFEEGGF
jgi:ABC-type multidrug transport system fused ATPase/permease subunit